MSDSRKYTDLSGQEREYARRYEALSEHTILAVFVSSLDGIVLEANQRAKSLTGYTDEDIRKGLDFDTIIAYPEYARRLKENRDQVLKDGKRDIQEFPVRCRDGSVIWVESESCVLSQNGKPYAFLGVAHDITRRKEAQMREDHLIKVLAAIRDINQFIVKEQESVKLIHTACGILTTVPSYESAWIVLLDENQKVTASAHSGNEEDFSLFEKDLKRRDTPQYLTSVIREKADVLLNYEQKESLGCGCLCASLEPGKSKLLLRIGKESQPKGILGISLPSGFAATREEKDLLVEVAGDIGSGLHRIELEKTLQSSHERLNRALKASGMAEWEWDIASGDLKWNPRLDHLFSAGPEVQVESYESYMAKVPREQRGALDSKIREFIRLGDPDREFRIEHPVRDESGNIRWIETRGKLAKGTNDRSLRMTGLLLDVTERKEKERQIQEQKDRIQKILDIVPNLLFIYDLKESRPVFQNKSLESYMGYSSQELQRSGSRFLDSVVHPHDLSTVRQYTEKLQFLEENEYAEIEYRMKDVEGNWHWFRNTHVVFSHEADGSVREVLGSASDITQRKKWEDALKESEESLRITLASIGDGVISTDTQGRIIRMNNLAEKLTGWPTEEAKGKLLRDVFRIYNAITGEPVDNPVTKVLSTGLIVGLANHTVLVSRTGEQYNISDSAAPITDEQNRIRGVVLAFTDNTEQYRLHQQIRETKERLELALDATEMGTWDWDITSDKVIYDHRWAKIVGYSPEELSPDMNTYNSLLHPEDRSLVFGEIRRHLSGEIPSFQVEHRFHTKSGATIWTLSRGRVIERDQKGKPVRACGTMLDITGRKTAQEKLRLSEERYRTYIKLTSDGVYRIELAEPIPASLSPELQVDLFYERAQVAEANLAFARMYGFESEEQLNGKKLPQFHGGRDKKQNRLFLKTLAQEDYRVTDFISDEVDKDGNQHFFLNNVFGIVENGQLVRIWGTQRDITDVRKSQMAEEKHLEEITKQKQFVQKIFDTNPNVLYVFDLEKQAPIFQNKHVARAIGYSDKQILSMGREVIDTMMHPDDFPEFIAHLQNMASASDNQILSIEYRMKDTSGNWRWFISHDTPFKRDEQGRVTQIIGTATEVTELKQAQSDLTRYQHRLEKANEELTNTNSNLQNANKRLLDIDKVKTEFVSMASHELRTPITSVLGFAQTLLAPDITLNREESRQYLQIIEREAVRLRDLVSDLLDLSKIESGRAEFKKEQVDLEELVKNTLEYLKVSPDKKISVISDEWGRKPVEADREKIRRVVLNIMENALRFGNRVEVRISGEPHERMVKISDNGPGIAPKHQGEIFEKFYRVQEEKSPGTGSGLGLAIAKEVVQSHGGRIWVESTPGRGTAFFFTIRE
ncbi:MAG: PAS domain-containing sensor histidine kinase [Fibrobacterota bacterium]